MPELIKTSLPRREKRQVQSHQLLCQSARGLMSRYIIENRLTQPEQLTAFNSEGYFFDEEASGNGELVF